MKKRGIKLTLTFILVIAMMVSLAIGTMSLAYAEPVSPSSPISPVSPVSPISPVSPVSPEDPEDPEDPTEPKGEIEVVKDSIKIIDKDGKEVVATGVVKTDEKHVDAVNEKAKIEKLDGNIETLLTKDVIKTLSKSKKIDAENLSVVRVFDATYSEAISDGTKIQFKINVKDFNTTIKNSDYTGKVCVFQYNTTTKEYELLNDDCVKIEGDQITLTVEHFCLFMLTVEKVSEKTPVLTYIFIALDVIIVVALITVAYVLYLLKKNKDKEEEVTEEPKAEIESDENKNEEKSEETEATREATEEVKEETVTTETPVEETKAEENKEESSKEDK